MDPSFLNELLLVGNNVDYSSTIVLGWYRYHQNRRFLLHMIFQWCDFWEPLLILHHFSKDSRSILLNKGSALTLMQTVPCLHYHSLVTMQGTNKDECDYSVGFGRFFWTNQVRCQKKEDTNELNGFKISHIVFLRCYLYRQKVIFNSYFKQVPESSHVWQLSTPDSSIVTLPPGVCSIVQVQQGDIQQYYFTSQHLALTVFTYVNFILFPNAVLKM